MFQHWNSMEFVGSPTAVIFSSGQCLVVSQLHHGCITHCIVYNWVSISSNSLQLDLSMLTLKLMNWRSKRWKIANTIWPEPVWSDFMLHIRFSSELYASKPAFLLFRTKFGLWQKTNQRMALDRQGESLSCEDGRWGDMGRIVWRENGLASSKRQSDHKDH